MATDGVKIIDGDLARDNYGSIMDLYDSGVEIDAIKKEIRFVKDDYGDDADFYHEIFVTSYALAFWEIGEISPEIIDDVKRVVSIGAGVKVWTEEAGQIEGRNRQKELDKLVSKISAPNLKIRKRKKHSVVKNLFFETDEVLTFRLANGNFHAIICAKVTQQRGQCTYDLVATTYSGTSKPTMPELLDSFILGHRIKSSYSREETELLQPGATEIWDYVRASRPFILGLTYMLVTHKDMVGLRGHFEKVGKLRIKEPLKKDGSYSYVTNFERFEDTFSNFRIHSHLETRKVSGTSAPRYFGLNARTRLTVRKFFCSR